MIIAFWWHIVIRLYSITCHSGLDPESRSTSPLTPLLRKARGVWVSVDHESSSG
ncbi:MAG: hypothetical protein KAY16_07990 [Spirochaetes bacterium]|nr:hypothetical protein [Spirochaetota bacterium]